MQKTDLHATAREITDIVSLRGIDQFEIKRGYAQIKHKYVYSMKTSRL